MTQTAQARRNDGIGNDMSSNIVMNKSQLRKLAREYSLGNLEEEEYRHRRRNLVDDIVCGKVAIVREVPPPPRQSYSEDPTTKVSIGPRAGKRRLSVATLFIAIVVVAGVIWMLIPSFPLGSGPDTGVEQSAQMPPASRARSLIDEFVAEKDFSAFSIASFKESWSHLTYSEKREAYAAHWFNTLINLISDEIKAQNALVESGESGSAVEMGQRLSEFARFLGISEYVTDFKSAPAPPPATVAASNTVDGADANAQDNSTESVVSPIKTQAQGDDATTSAPQTDWLGAQPADAFTLQLFAVNRLDEIQNLIASNPDANLQVLVSAQNEPRYRVVYGAFDTEDAARNAYAGLPDNIRQAQPIPLVKSVTSLREEIGTREIVTQESISNTWVASLDAKMFTLQVFATDSVDSARRLQKDYPTLELNLLETTNPYTRYRVLYGAFVSEELARKAAGGLPPELLRHVGKPLVKPVSELKAVSQ